MNATLLVGENLQNVNCDGTADLPSLTMADKENAAEQEEKLNKPEIGYPDTAQPDDKEPHDDAKTKFINGGNALDDAKVEVRDTVSDASFTGLGKEELKKYEQDPFWVRLRWVLFIIFWVGWMSMLVAAIVIIVLAPRCPYRPDLKWYEKDAFYNIYAKSFFDGRKPQDGYGDLEGIEKKADYVASLNVNSYWLSSIIKTEGNDDRAVLDHMALDEKFGTLGALKAFCKKLAKDGKRVIMDFIPNQTSRNHTWFKQSQKRQDKYTDYYVWADRVAGLSPNNWERDDKSGKMWVWDRERGQYYLSQFDGTADLNLTNTNVLNEFKKIMQFWVGQGISGFHVNDLEYLTENPDYTASNTKGADTKHFRDNALVVDSLRKIVDGLENKPGREKLLMGTVRINDTEQLKLYGGQNGKQGLHVIAMVLDDLTSVVTAQDLQAKLELLVNGSINYRLGWRLTTARPGSRRVFSRVGGDRMTTAVALMAMLPGNALPYYGDEISMADGLQSDRRTVTPMQWSKEQNGGFSGHTPWLPVNKNYTIKNVDSGTAQLRFNTMMETFKALMSMRTNESLQFGETLFCSTDDLLIFTRRAAGFDSIMVAANMGSSTTHKFAGSKCIGSHKTAKLVFHSHKLAKQHKGVFEMDSAVHVGRSEILVFRFSA